MKKCLTVILVVGMICATAWAMFALFVGKTMDFANRAGDAAARVAETFSGQRITTLWRDSVSEVAGTNRLQVATLQSLESFTRSDAKSILWEMIDLPEVVVRLDAPVEFVFYLDLAAPWEFFWDEEERVVTVLAPKIRWNRPSVDISRMRFSTVKGSFLRNEKGIRDEFVRDMDRILTIRSRNKVRHIREIARSETRKFVQNWFVNVAFRDDEIKPTVGHVHFADETLPESLGNRRLARPAPE